jgi:predicted RNase H-like nuclease (RuvC/YqgF family)
MEEVQRLQSVGQLTTMRRTDNGGFNANLLFHADTARYFVLLSQGQEIWRVVQATDSAQALRIYEDLAGQSAALAADEIRRLELKAQTEAAQRELKLAQAQARQMAEELEADRRYRAMIEAQESQSRADVSALQQQRQKLQEQLQAEQRRVMELRRQLDPSATQTGVAAGGRRSGQADCRVARPGQPVSAAERELPLCGPDGRPRTQAP